MTSTMSALQTGERVNRIEYYTALMNQLLTIGESMLTSGAGVNKVEETLAAIGRAYGASRMDVFVITSCAIVTMYPEDSCAVTQTPRSEGIESKPHELTMRAPLAAASSW